MEQALAMNLTRAIGVSNYPKKQLASLLKGVTIAIGGRVIQTRLLHCNSDSPYKI